MANLAIVGSRGYPSTYGGFETFVRHLAPHLVSCGDQVTVYGRSGEPGETVVDGVRSVVTRGVDSNALSTLSFGATATLHSRRESYDSALILNVANGYFLRRWSRAGVRTVVNPDGLEWRRGKWGRTGKAIFKRGAVLTAKYADHIVVDSLEIGRIWREDFHRTSTFIPYGADVEYDIGDDSVKSIGLRPDQYVLVVARLVPENNIALFLDALDLLPASIPVVVAGSANKPNELTARLETLAASRPDFHWLGHVSDQELLKQLWANAAVYFHGHSVGGTNPALLQALGYGAPTVAVHTPYNAEVVGTDVQLVEPTAREVSAALQRVLDDTALRERFVEDGRKTIDQRYRWADVVAGYRAAMLGQAQPAPAPAAEQESEAPASQETTNA